MAKISSAKSYLLLVLLVAMVGLGLNDTQPAVPAVYLFGDSIFDVGTNNFLANSTARADKEHYGVDFPNSEATGRFSNGFNTADSIVEFLGFKRSPPPFLSLLNDTENFNSQILRGINFASGGSGLLNDTGKSFNGVIFMAEQVQQFTTVHGNISELLNDTADSMINKALFLFSVGSNDIIEFGVSHNFSASETEVQEFFSSLMSSYEAHLRNLAKLGARKLGILSVPPVGCIPFIRVLSSKDFECESGLNDVAQMFETALEGILQKLSSEFPGLKFSLAKSYDITIRFINDPPNGFNEVKSACCGNTSLTLRATTDCGPHTELCEDRSTYLFWDRFHPTEIASKLAAFSVVYGANDSVTPINLGLLASHS